MFESVRLLAREVLLSVVGQTMIIKPG